MGLKEELEIKKTTKKTPYLISFHGINTLVPSEPSYPRTLVPSYLRTLVPSYPYTLVPSYPRTLIPKYPRTLIPSYPYTLVPSYPRTFVPLYPRTLVPLYPRTLIPSYPRTLIVSISFSRRLTICCLLAGVGAPPMTPSRLSNFRRSTYSPLSFSITA